MFTWFGLDWVYTISLWHAQSRHDRDNFISSRWENLKQVKEDLHLIDMLQKAKWLDRQRRRNPPFEDS
ncbi:hypothetical protein KIN20_013560 [Parelaphostrongylus tenuis]|uniref:Peptidase M12A domain-containing protein n=1 Tax=Parelaphostrongylus tenuis TaxID=148309 RepID=A0AAD5QNM7_PARTN|nr:hypothetical protein KIN20_013560 [Parelaphostrongylus tenuis]